MLSASALGSPDLDILYIGSNNGPEKFLVEQKGVRFESISCGKFRRYFSLENFLDFFRVIGGFFQSLKILKKLKPNVVFSKGGYVSVPVCFAAWMLKIPVVLHESDVTPGLANRICGHFAKAVCVSFDETKKFFPLKKILVTGNPVRPFVLKGDQEKGFRITGFTGQKPVLLIMGGSLGAEYLNELVFGSLCKLLQHIDIVHITGKGKFDLKKIFHVDENLLKEYKCFEFLDEELPHIYAISDLVVSRAGANSIAEIVALEKPSILIPLGRDASRGDQLENAKFMEMAGASIVAENIETPREFANIILNAINAPEKLARMKAHSAILGQHVRMARQKIAELLYSFAS